MQVGQIDPQTRHAVNAFLARVSARYDVVGARLYGSRARGDHKPDSDVDLAVFLRGARKQKGDLLNAAMEMGGIAFDAMSETDLFVSALPVWEAEWEHPDLYNNPRLLENIQREGVSL